MIPFAKIAEYGLGIVKGSIDLLLGRQKAQERAEYREAGRNEQKVADAQKAVAVKDEQLAVAAKPDETREELLTKAKGRRRGG